VLGREKLCPTARGKELRKGRKGAYHGPHEVRKNHERVVLVYIEKKKEDGEEEVRLRGKKKTFGDDNALREQKKNEKRRKEEQSVIHFKSKSMRISI